MAAQNSDNYSRGSVPVRREKGVLARLSNAKAAAERDVTLGEWLSLSKPRFLY